MTSSSNFHFTSVAPGHISVTQIGLFLVLTLALYWLSSAILQRRSKLAHHTTYKLPPIVHIPEEEILNNHNEAYASALKQHGPVIGIWFQEQLEYIVRDEYTRELFINDQDSLDRGIGTVLNLWYLAKWTKGKFFDDIRAMISGKLIPEMNRFVDQTFPIFERQARQFVRESQRLGSGVDFYLHSHRCVMEAMIVAAFGESYATERNIALAAEVMHPIAFATGNYQSTSIFARTFPMTWKMIAWARVLFITIPFKSFPLILPIVWKEIRGRKFRPLNSTSSKEIDEESHKEALIHYAARMFVDDQGTVPFLSILWIHLLMLSFVFSSVHEASAFPVWVMYEICLRKENTSAIREELSTIADSIDSNGVHKLSYEGLRRATFLDSCIREALRLKGNTVSVIRTTTRDVRVGEYTIPKGNLICLLSTMIHGSKEIYGEDASEFKPSRWADGPAASTTGPGYLPFGVGKWACPGRILVVAEIKMMILTLLAICNPELEGGKYTVVDPFSVLNVPPAGRLILHPLAKEGKC